MSTEAKELVERLRGRRVPGKWSDTTLTDPLCIESAALIEKQAERHERMIAAFKAYVSEESSERQMAIALCLADGNNPDAIVSIDGGPLQRHWIYYSDAARQTLEAHS